MRLVGIPGRLRLGQPASVAFLERYRIIAMLDFLMLVYGVGFFAVAVLYVLACEKM